MDEKPDQIMNHIESQRDQLGRNLNELESRVKRTTDWRAQFDSNPMLMMGVALGGGLLLGTMVGGSRSRSSRTSSWSSSPRSYSSSSSGMSSSASYATSPSTSSVSSSPAMREQRRKASDTLENMKAALIGFATAKVKEFMSEALPGFSQHLEEAEHRQRPSGEFTATNTGYPGGSGYSPSGSFQGGGSQTGSQQGGSQHVGSQPGGSQPGSYQGGTRTEQSSSTPYRQEPVGANPARNL
jgi:hypothetical protein